VRDLNLKLIDMAQANTEAANIWTDSKAAWVKIDAELVNFPKRPEATESKTAVASLAHPGGNITGLAASSNDTAPKQLESWRACSPWSAEGDRNCDGSLSRSGTRTLLGPGERQTFARPAIGDVGCQNAIPAYAGIIPTSHSSPAKAGT
jgi:hypothetical protein